MYNSDLHFFSARPEQRKKGIVKGMLLRAGIVVEELTWNEVNAKAVLVSKSEQTFTIEGSKGVKKIRSVTRKRD